MRRDAYLLFQLIIYKKNVLAYIFIDPHMIIDKQTAPVVADHVPLPKSDHGMGGACYGR